jgi:hypothetical protein
MTIRKPRIAIMGEFSSGKSTLCNLLMGARPLLEKVTATQLPPVLVSYGDAPAYREDMDGVHHPLELNDLGSVDLEDTRLVHIFMQSDVLEMCDLIDMPGISDPNMSSEVWERVIPMADGILWCTHATQAWRQSEAGVWASLPSSLYENSLMLITRFDKILGDSDRLRVLKRVATETEGLFSGLFPISLTGAIAAGDDNDLWVESGAHAFAEAFLEMVLRLSESGLYDETAKDQPRLDDGQLINTGNVAEEAAATSEVHAEQATPVTTPDIGEPSQTHAFQHEVVDESDSFSGDETESVSSAAAGASSDTVVRVTPRRVQSKSTGAARPRGDGNIVYLTERPASTVETKDTDLRLRSIFT